MFQSARTTAPTEASFEALAGARARQDEGGGTVAASFSQRRSLIARRHRAPSVSRLVNAPLAKATVAAECALAAPRRLN
jgi:hypothetical protein